MHTAQRPDTAAIVLSGGSGTRLGRQDGMNKVYLPLAGRPIASWSMAVLGSHPSVARLILVIRPGDEDEATSAITAAKVGGMTTVVHGGATRTDSEHAGIDALADDISSGAMSAVMIHDGARPFIDHALIDRLLAAVSQDGGAIPGLAMDEGVIELSSRSPATRSLSIANSQRWFRVQTPQAFRATALVAAYNKARQANHVGFDTAELVRWAGGPLARLVVGSQTNLKVTTPADLRWAEAHAAKPL